MTTSILPARYKINGILDTKAAVMSNLETLCNACGTFMSYDIHTGLWSVIINTTGSSVKSFTNANIIGPIQVSGTSLQNLFNRVRVEFPLRDTSDGTDFIEIEIPEVDRYPNEPDSTLQMTLQMCNEPVQATIIGLIELKQSRIDQIITFISDYSTLSLNAGDIISVTNDIYQFSAKPFRIISLREVDTESGSIQIEITALAYDANVYSVADLGRFIRTDRNGIVGIGSISAPITPVIYNFATDVRPGIVIETVVPAGIVESMEFWVSTDNTNFVSVGSQTPVGGGSFDSGDVVTLEYNQVATANYYVKTRGINSTTAGPFSPVVSFIGFVPVQTTDALTPTTNALDSSGNILNTLALTGLLKLLDNLIAQNSASAAGGIFDKYNTTFESVTGKTITDVPVLVQNVFTISNTTVMSKLAAMSATTLDYGIYDIANTGNRSNWISASTTLTQTFNSLSFEIKLPTVVEEYYYKDQTDTLTLGEITAQPAFFVNILFGASLATATLVSQSTVDWTTNTATATIDDTSIGTYWLALQLIPTYDLSLNWTVRGGSTVDGNKIFLTNFTSLGTSSDVIIIQTAIQY
jgi:hypothetical protein